MSKTSELLPRHLGLILDGNRRWAEQHGLPRFEGHRSGFENLKTIGKAALDRGVSYVTAYVFSTENWNRSKEEVTYLMKLLKWVATHEVNELHKDNIRVRFLGSRELLKRDLLRVIDAAEEKTKNNTAGTIAFCLSYGGKQEIVDAIKQIVRAQPRVGDINEQLVDKNLYAPDIPAVDLVIRTSGEQRLSNFMLWRIAYSELLFVDVHWPAFTVDHLDVALRQYALRQRRFGK